MYNSYWDCAGYSEKLNQLVTLYVQEQHIAILLRLVPMKQLTRLSSQLHTQFATTTMSRGRRGQGVAIFIHNSLAGLVRMWKISELYQAVWVYIMDQFLGYGRECFWGLCTIILALPHVLMLRFPRETPGSDLRRGECRGSAP